MSRPGAYTDVNAAGRKRLFAGTILNQTYTSRGASAGETAAVDAGELPDDGAEAGRELGIVASVRDVA